MGAPAFVHGSLADAEDLGHYKGTNRLGIRTYQRRFLVEASKQFGPYSVGSLTGLPVIGTPHNEDPFAYCHEIDVSVKPDSQRSGTVISDGTQGHIWYVTVKYTTEREIAENPLDEPAILEWDSEEFQEEVWKNRSGEAIVNTAGDVLRNIFRDRTRLIASFTQNLSSIPSWILTHVDNVNSAAFTFGGFSVAANEAKFQGPKIPHFKIRNGVQYYEVSGQFHFRADLWKVFPRNEGMRQKFVPASTQRVPCTNDDGTAVRWEVPLDASGFQIDDPTAADIIFVESDIYNEISFTTILNDLIGV